MDGVNANAESQPLATVNEAQQQECAGASYTAFELASNFFSPPPTLSSFPITCRKQGPFHTPILPAPSCSACFWAWESASPCSDDMEECVLNQAQTCLLRWKHSMMSMTNPSSQLVQNHTSPGFPENAQRRYMKDKPKVDTGSMQRNFWMECKKSGSHQPSSLFIPLSTTRCSMHSAKAGEWLCLPGLQELPFVCPVVGSEVV